MDQRTPPNWPIYGVKLTKEEITNLVERVFPGAQLTEYNELAFGKSFNNRIYFLTLDHSHRYEPDLRDYPTDVVLKVIGRFFGPNKVQNEIASLLLLEKFCPTIPSPRVFAWSEDGTKMNAIRDGVYGVIHDPMVDGNPSSTTLQGWLMTSKLPGRSLQPEELKPVDSDLVNQLAEIVAAWRTNIPPREEVGNLSLQPTRENSSNDVHGLKTTIASLLFADAQPDQPPKNSLQYFHHLLTNQLLKINSKDVFAPLRPRLSESLEKFRSYDLPRLPFLIDNFNEKAVFTHQDFSPRNILVSPSADNPAKLTVTGVLDFEFSGFFPIAEEYLNSIARQSEDWNKPFWTALMAALKKAGVAVPGDGIDVDYFTGAVDLTKMIDSLAPWWLEDAQIKGEELQKQLEVTYKVVQDLLGRLHAMAHGKVIPSPTIDVDAARKQALEEVGVWLRSD